MRVRIRFGESVTECCSELNGAQNATNDCSNRDFEVFLQDYSNMRFGETGFRFVRLDFYGAVKIKSILAESHIYQRKAGRTNEHGEGLTLEENGVKKILNQTCKRFGLELSGDPNGTRTHVTTVKGWCLNRLTMGPSK